MMAFVDDEMAIISHEIFHLALANEALDQRHIDAAGQLPDGTELNDVTDLKRYLVNNIDVFSGCLTEKLLVYATGREPGYGDRKEIHRIVNRTKEQGNGFQDLIVELVLSESFRTK